MVRKTNAMHTTTTTTVATTRRQHPITIGAHFCDSTTTTRGHDNNHTNKTMYTHTFRTECTRTRITNKVHEHGPENKIHANSNEIRYTNSANNLVTF